MKIGELASFGHNIADSLASGICFMVGIYSADIHGEAAASPEGHIDVDFLTGTTSGSPVSTGLKRTIQKYAEMLPELATRHNLNAAEIKALSARFGTDPVAGPHFLVTVEASDGRRSVDQYAGIPGKRYGRSRRSAA
nr:orf137EGC113 [uncultured bacterium]